MPPYQHRNAQGQRGNGGRPAGAGWQKDPRPSVQIIDAPYNFVPLSQHVFLPEWAPQVSHDIPFADGLSGEIHYTLRADAPLLVGGRQEKPSNDAPGVVKPFTLPDGRHAIPGSSLKGLLRNVVEIAAFGRFNKLDDVRPAFRDVSSRNVPYRDRMSGGKVKTGFLRRTSDGEIQIIPCAMTRLDHRELEQALGLGEGKPIFPARQSVNKKYECWRRLCEGQGLDPRRIRFDHDGDVACALFKGRLEGVPVFTGQISDSTKPGGKSRDFIFYHPQPEQAIKVCDEVWRDFLQVHGDEVANPDMSWPGYWRQHFRGGGDVPVFYLPATQNPESPLRVGLAFMPKLAGDFSTHDLVKNVHETHLESPGLAHGYDMADLLFGAINGESQADALRGRVNCEMAITLSPITVQVQPPTILNGPKPSYFPNYVAQDVDSSGLKLRNGQYATYLRSNGSSAPKLRGFKRYPVRPDADVQVQRLTQDQLKNKKVQVVMHTLPAGSKFHGRIVFHNLRPVEVGALLWVLTWGGNPSLRHSIGMGKSFGFGQVRFELHGERCRVIPNDPMQSEGCLTPEAVAGYIDIFEERMNVAIPDWKRSPQLSNLLAMADVGRAHQLPKGMRLRHMQLEFGNNPFQRAKQLGLVLPDYAVASGAARSGPIASAPVAGVKENEVERGGVKLTWNKSNQTLQVVFNDANPVRKATACGKDALQILQGMPAAQRARLEKSGELAGATVTVRVLGNLGTIQRVHMPAGNGGNGES